MPRQYADSYPLSDGRVAVGDVLYDPDERLAYRVEDIRLGIPVTATIHRLGDGDEFRVNIDELDTFTTDR